MYLFVVNVWNYLKTLLAANHDEQAPPTPPRRLQSPAASPPTPEPEPAMASVVTQETTGEWDPEEPGRAYLLS